MDNTLIAPLEWRTEQRLVKELVPYDYNPRKLTEEKRSLLIRSIEKFNLAEIPAVNTDNVIIAGHQRVKVMMDIGRGDEVIDVRVPSRTLTELEFKEYNITSNVPVGFWDVEILEAHFGDVDLETLGLFLADIEIPGDAFGDEGENEEEQDFDPTPPKEAITVIGDVYDFVSTQKGIVHRLVCGDSTQNETYKRLGPEEFDLVVTDPPYNVNYEGGTKAKLKIENDNMSSGDFYTFLYLFYQEAFLKAKPGAGIYVFHADSEGDNFRRALKESGYKLSQCLIWLKNSIVMGRQDYHWKHEPCLYGWKEGAAHNWYSDRKQSTILEFDKPLRNEEHPTMKPLELFSYLIKNSSKQRDIVADPFGGSGTTLISCEKTWRQARVIELGANYADVHVKRYIKYMRDNNLQFEIVKNGQKLSKEQFELYFNE
ncbi:MAG: DNA modification methylase [Bacteroidota bacterium]